METLPEQMSRLVHEYRSLRDEKDAVEERLKAINGRISALREKELPGIMIDNEIQKMSFKGVGTIYLETDVYAHIRADDKPEAFAWFHNNGLGDLITETINWRTLRGWVKDRQESGEEVPEFCNAKPMTTATLRRS